jgi:hypothetical protein
MSDEIRRNGSYEAYINIDDGADVSTLRRATQNIQDTIPNIPKAMPFSLTVVPLSLVYSQSPLISIKHSPLLAPSTRAHRS